MNKISKNKKTIRFRRWSRKAYAAFASLGKLVTIGCLPKDIADSSLSKQKTGTSKKRKTQDINLNRSDDVGDDEKDKYISSGGGNYRISLLTLLFIIGAQPVLCETGDGRQRGNSTFTIRKENVNADDAGRTNCKIQILWQPASSAFSFYNHSN